MEGIKNQVFMLKDRSVISLFENMIGEISESIISESFLVGEFDDKDYIKNQTEKRIEASKQFKEAFVNLVNTLV